MSSHPLDCTPGDEECPLLKMSDVPGEGVQTKVWSVSNSRRKCWRNRLPEFMSACWMSLILLGVCLLAIYTLGLAMSRRQAVMLQYLKTTNKLHPISTNPLLEGKSKVFYVQVVKDANSIAFLKHEDYLTQMALSYPNLYFETLYLIDDALKYSFHGLRHGRFFNKIIPNTVSCKINVSVRKAICDFEKKLNNVNVTIMPLSSYMNNTPLKKKWKQIPICQLSFYIRTYSVWQHGGISLDLTTFFNKYLNGENINYKIIDIFEKHNKGISNQEFTTITTTTTNYNEDEMNASNEILHLFKYLTYFVDQAWNESRSIMDRSFGWATLPSNDSSKVLTRVHRSKRNILQLDNENLQEEKYSSVNDSVPFINNTKSIYQSDSTNQTQDTLAKTNNTVKVSVINITSMNNDLKNKTEIKKIELPKILYYDFSFLNDGFIPHVISDTLTPEFNDKKDFTKQVALDIDGNFVAAYTKNNSFLSRLLSYSFGKFSIEEVIFNECYSFFSPNYYCNNIVLI